MPFEMEIKKLSDCIATGWVHLINDFMTQRGQSLFSLDFTMAQKTYTTQRNDINAI